MMFHTWLEQQSKKLTSGKGFRVHLLASCLSGQQVGNNFMDLLTSSQSANEEHLNLEMGRLPVVCLRYPI